MKTKKITQRYYIKYTIKQPSGTYHLMSHEISESEYHDWAALLNQLSVYDGKKWGAIKGMTDKYGWVEGYAISQEAQ